MATLLSLAAEFHMQPYEVAATLDLGAADDWTTELDPATEAEYRDVLTHTDAAGVYTESEAE